MTLKVRCIPNWANQFLSWNLVALNLEHARCCYYFSKNRQFWLVHPKTVVAQLLVKNIDRVAIFLRQTGKAQRVFHRVPIDQ